MHIVHMHVYVHALKYAQNVDEFTVFERIPKHMRKQPNTQRCDLPGKAAKRCYVRKHLAMQTELHKASACSKARIQGSAPNVSLRRGKKARE